MPSDVRFQEVEKMLTSGGYTLQRIRGSHHIFAKSGRFPISIPVHRGKVKYGYVERIKTILAKEQAGEGEN